MGGTKPAAMQDCWVNGARMAVQLAGHFHRCVTDSCGVFVALDGRMDALHLFAMHRGLWSSGSGDEFNLHGF